MKNMLIIINTILLLIIVWLEIIDNSYFTKNDEIFEKNIKCQNAYKNYYAYKTYAISFIKYSKTEKACIGIYDYDSKNNVRVINFFTNTILYYCYKSDYIEDSEYRNCVRKLYKEYKNS